MIMFQVLKLIIIAGYNNLVIAENNLLYCIQLLRFQFSTIFIKLELI